jgi:hypothetical protein
LSLARAGPTEPVAAVARLAPWPVALANFHKPFAGYEFTISPCNCIVEVTTNLATLCGALLGQFSQSF